MILQPRTRSATGRRSAFTLLEVLVVVAIILVLASVATVAVLPVGLIEGGTHLLSLRSLVLGCTVGMLSSAIPYSFENEALRRIAPSVCGVLMSLEPAMAALAGLIILGQGLGTRSVLGIALVVCASAGASRRTREAPRDV